MPFPLYMVLPIVAALMYAYGSLYFKEAFEHGISVIHTFVITSWAMALVFVPLLFISALPPNLESLIQPALCAGLFFLGHWFTFAAIRRGDMSIVVPAMGTKAIFVAIGASVFFGKTVNPTTWTATVLAAIGIYVLGKSDRTKSKGISIAVLLTIMSSACFGFCDAAIQAWAPSYGAKGFLGMTFLMIAGLASLFLRAADEPLRKADKQGMKALFIGASIIALQGILVSISVVNFDNATGVNIVYTSRGLWSVLLVWWIGHRFHSSEKHQDRKLLFVRLIGAAIMMAAVGLALRESAN